MRLTPQSLPRLAAPHRLSVGKRRRVFLALANRPHRGLALFRGRCGRASGPRRGDRSRAAARGPPAPTPRSVSGSPRSSTPLTRACNGRSTSTVTLGMLRQPSSATTASSESHSISGLTSAVGSASEPAAKTSSRRRTPSWVAARPTPDRVVHDRRPSARPRAQLVAELRDRRGLAVQHRIAELTSWASAASRRSSSSGSSVGPRARWSPRLVGVSLELGRLGRAPRALDFGLAVADRSQDYPDRV